MKNPLPEDKQTEIEQLEDWRETPRWNHNQKGGWEGLRWVYESIQETTTKRQMNFPMPGWSRYGVLVQEVVIQIQYPKNQCQCFDNYASVMIVGVQNKCELSACSGKFLYWSKQCRLMFIQWGRLWYPQSHSTPWKLLNYVLKGSIVIEACSMAKLMQQNTQFQLSKIMRGPWKEFENFDDLMGKFCWNLTPKMCGTKAAKGSNDQLYIKGCFSK